MNVALLKELSSTLFSTSSSSFDILYSSLIVKGVLLFRYTFGIVINPFIVLASAFYLLNSRAILP